MNMTPLHVKYYVVSKKSKWLYEPTPYQMTNTNPFKNKLSRNDDNLKYKRFLTQQAVEFVCPLWFFKSRLQYTS